MGPKKDAPKAGGVEGEEGNDPALFLSNYQKLAKYHGLGVSAGVTKCLTDEEKSPMTQLLVDNTYDVLGSGGCRCLMTALLGQGQVVKGGPYKLINSIRLWRSNIGDDGVGAIAEVLRLGGGDVKISYLELLDNNIGPRGGIALAESLSRGKNLSLLTLKLDYNGTFQTEGCINLCRGLRTNHTLKQLHMSYCKLTYEAGKALSEVLRYEKSALTALNLCGNPMTGSGLFYLCEGLLTNKVLESLNVSDNSIEESDEDLAGLQQLADVIRVRGESALTSVDMSYNRIGERGAGVLSPALAENKTIRDFYVDTSLPERLFEALFRDGAGGKAKKGKKGKK